MKLNEAIEPKGLDKLKQTWDHIDKVLLTILIFFLGMLGALSAAAQDTTPPTITNFSPAVGETGVARDVGTLTMTLSEPVYANPDLSDSYDHFNLRYAGGSVIQSFEIDGPDVTISGNTITLNNVMELNYGESYTVQNNSGGQGMVKDAAGNKLADFSYNTWNFTTRSSDLYIVSTYPSDGAQLIDPRANEDFSVTFNQPVFKTSLTWWVQIRDVSNTDIEGFSTGVPSHMEISGNTITFKRTAQLPYGEELHFYIPLQAFKDANNRNFEGIAYGDHTTWNFTTKSEVDPPQISSLDPAHGEEGVDLAQNVFTIRFNETVSIDRAGYIGLYLKTKSGATLVDQTDPQDIVYNKGNYQIPFDGHRGLVEGGQYYISIGDNIFHDAQENYFAGTNIDNWSFYANRKPTNISLTNATVMENQPAGTVVGTVSGTDPDQGDQATVTLVGGTHASSFEIVGTQLRTTEALDYESGTTRSITLRATDNGGATFDKTLTINITDEDDTPPVLITSDPEDDATGVDLSPTLTYTFNEDVDITDAVTSTFYLRKVSGGGSVASWQAVPGSPLPAGMSIVGDQMIFEVAATLEYDTEYYFAAPAISDLAGNEASVFGNPSFTTRAASHENDILTLSAEGMIGDAVIDPINHTVTATMSPLASYNVSFDATLSDAASSSITSSTFAFESGVGKPIAVQAESGFNQPWTITLTWESFDGTYTVGEGGDTPSLGYAFYYLEEHGLVGDVVFEILDGHVDLGTTYIKNPDPTYSVTIRPVAGASSISFEGTGGSRLWSVDADADNILIDGEDPISGNRVIHFNNKNTNYGNISAVFLSRNDDFTIRNCKFTVSRGYGIRTGTGSGGSSNLLIENNEFIIDAQDNAQSIYGISVEWGSPSNFMIRNNTIYQKSGSTAAQYFTGIQTLNGGSIVNNSIAMASSGFVGINASSRSNDEVVYNTIHLYGNNAGLSEPSILNGLRLVNNSGTLKVQNNNIYITRAYTAATTKAAIFFYSGYDDQTISYNNMHIVDDGVSSWEYVTNGSFGHYQLESEVLNYMPNSTFSQSDFTDVANGDLSLFGDARGYDDLRGTPVDGVDTDILGNSRSGTWPSKGAYEVPNRASDFLTFSIPQQVSAPTINTDNHTVAVAVNGGTSLTNLVPTFTISPGASIDKASGDEQDFTSPVSYFIQDEQEFAQQEWVVTVSEQNIAPSAIALSMLEIDENAATGTVVGEVSGTDANGDELVFSLVSGEGSDHNTSFTIDTETNELKSTAVFDHEITSELYIRIQADDQNGETFEAEFVITVLDVDEINPAVEGYGPANNDVEVELDTEPYIQYYEDVYANSGSYYLYKAGGQLVEELAVDGAGVDVSRAVVTMTPSQNLEYNTSYYIEAAANVVADEAGNPAPAITAGAWSFSTANPITAWSPADEADDVSPFAHLEITFDRTVSIASGGTFKMYKTADDSQVGSNWDFDTNATLDGNTITYDIPIDLEPGVELYVEIIGGIEDEDGNPIDITGSDTWNFTPVKQDQIVTLNAIPTKTYGDAGFAFTAATATSGLQVFSYSSIDPTVADLADNHVTIMGAGTTTIRATQAGNTYYNSAYAEQVFTVEKANQTISFTQPTNMKYGDAPQTIIATVQPSGDDAMFEITAGDAVILDTETNEVTVVGTGEVTIRATSLETDNYNAPMAVERTFTVHKKTITARVEDEEKTYGEDNPDFTITYEGLIDGESSDVIDEQPIASTAADEESNAGLYDITLTGGEDDHYEFDLEDGFLRIHKKALIAKADAATRAYGDANPSFLLSFEGYVNGDKASDLVGSLPIRTTTADSSSPVGEYTISVSGGEDLNYDFVPENGTLTITKAELEVAAVSLEKDYGEENPTLEIAYDGFKNEESSVDLITWPTVSTEATKFTSAGAHDITVSGGVAENYTFNYVKGTLTINKLNLAAVAVNQARVYGVPNPALTITYSGFIDGEDESDLDNPPVATTSAHETSDVGEYAIDVPAVDDANYVIMPTSGTLTINKADQIITLVDIADKVKSAAPFDVVASVNSSAPLTYLVSGPANNDDETITLTGELGTVTVTVSAPASTNYHAASAQVSFDVNDLLVQTISFAIADQIYGGSVILDAVASSSLAVAYGNISGPASLSGNTLTFTGVGEVSIQATQSGNGEFNEAEPVSVTFTIGKAPLTATANDQSFVYGEAMPELTFAYDGFVNGDEASDLGEEPSVSTTATATSDAGTYVIELSGGTAANYTLTLVDAELTIEKATATVVLAALIHDEDGTAKSPAVTTDPADLNVTLTYDGGTDAPSSAGSYEVVATIEDSNYQGTATATLVINEATVTGVDPQNLEVSVYPNPTSDWLAVSGITSPSASLSLVDVEGRTVLQQQVTPNQKVDVSNIKSGLYFLQMNQQGFAATTTTKILIHR